MSHSHLDALRSRLDKHRARASLIPGLAELLDTLIAHLVETDARLTRLEADVLPRLTRIQSLLEELEERV